MKQFILFIYLLLMVKISPAQNDISEKGRDTLRLTIGEAETMFLNRNLDLIAQRFSIDSAKATVITARLFDNPELDFSNAFYNPDSHNFFGPEVSAQISQLIRLAGKRKKAVNFAKSGVDVAQFQFYDLMRTLRFILRNDFYNIYFLQQSAGVYETEIASLKDIVSAYREQVNKGNIAPADLLRIQSQLYTLEAEYNNLQTNINQIQIEFKGMIRANPLQYFLPEPDLNDLNENAVSATSYQALIDSAMINRPDLKALNAGIDQSKYNLVLQKSYATPDITVNANYDRLGSYIRNYNAIGISVPLPLFNRNQGNIQNARVQLDVSKTIYEAEMDKVKNEVTANYITALQSQKLLQSIDPRFQDNMKKLIEQVTLNFQKRNISILEFLDHYDAYKQNVLQINELRFNEMSALEQLNLSIGKTLFNK